ncbi:DUF1674-domain-containing protein [Cucurbitaria berberidis CBS 394.84]|uniref:Succinate dehydrogenase assembly factor 4, mitochondrial n=1 Tax=Cucurbitaria berberidis CBS 394.84 TaxID=1168544 RepID=A0A9P4LEJ8_9PLEO|nr:DUF1674-domain-containing protein [Cucurbitaria berberidis CBS 394.84]KAF1852008.1 DUF1674-domain-containing protein [Cucurbitaria berberidis CBS 394.84]
MATIRRTLTHLPRHLSRRPFSTSRSHLTQSPFGSGPAPPRLPKEEQEIFEKLQRQSTGAFSTPREDAAPTTTEFKSSTRMQINQSPDSAPGQSSTQQLPQSGRMQINQSPDSSPETIRFENGKQIRKGEDLHPNIRRGAPPEFEGDVNPKTGEVGGPKNEPLRWGGQGDWSYNGRVTDF